MHLKKVEKEKEEKVERLTKERESGWDYDHKDEEFHDKAMSGQNLA